MFSFSAVDARKLRVRGCDGGDLDGTGDMLIRGIEDCSKTWSVAEELLKRNYSEQTVEDIMWNNARNYLAKMLPEK